ncbi:MAG: hypothetical protein FJ245_12200 [Nitrospira sp.]|nr:hypothetical protein [Nitrospira sp.]
MAGALLIVIALGIAVVVLLVKWFQRCPRCNSMGGPKGRHGSLMPGNKYKVKRMCRKCGHAWEEIEGYDFDTTA